jgi:predicted permease
MQWWDQTRRRLAALRHRDRFDRDLAEEMHSHLEMQARENRENGMSGEAARRAAMRQFGNATALKELSREAWGWGGLERFFQDVRYALRLVRRSPGSTAIATLSLAIGIGANTAIFGVVDNLLLRPLPVREPERLVSITHGGADSDFYEAISYPDYKYYRDHNAVFTQLAAYSPDGFTVGDNRIPIQGETVSANYFATLGIAPAMGRWFAPDEDKQSGVGAVAVLGYGLWQRLLGGDPAAIGRQITVNRRRLTIVGIAPKGFAGLPAGVGAPCAEIWVPVSMEGELFSYFGGQDPLHVWGNTWIRVAGRLKPGLSLAAAASAMRAVSRELDPQRTAVWGPVAATWIPALEPVLKTRLAPRLRSSVATGVPLLAGIFALVLIMACVNMAGLLLAGMLKRQREIAVRMSLGASRGRVLRQLLIESLVVAAIGGAAGVLVAWRASASLLLFERALGISLAGGTVFHARVLVFAVAATVLSAILAGIVPARYACGCDLSSAMKADSAGLVAGSRRRTLHGLPMAAQVAFSLVLLAGAGLFLRTLANERAADITVDPGHVLLTTLDVHARKYDQRRALSFFAELLERVHAIPGVKSAAVVMVTPLGGNRGGTNIRRSGGRQVQVDWNVVSPRYFETVGIPLVRGRAFTDRDRGGAPRVVAINEQFALRFFPGQDPIGKSVELTFSDKYVAEVIGIVRDGPFQGVRDPVKPCFYQPVAQNYFPLLNMSLEVRTIGKPAALAPAVGRAIQSLDKDFPVGEMRTLESHREDGLARERMITALLAAFAGMALALAVAGIYGVASVTVAQRRREIGLRMALGAGAASVLRLAMGRTLWLVAAGMAAGLAGALLLTRFVSSLLFGVKGTDPATFVPVCMLLIAVALAASSVPARRATRIDPLEALRHD